MHKTKCLLLEYIIYYISLFVIFIYYYLENNGENEGPSNRTPLSFKVPIYEINYSMLFFKIFFRATLQIRMSIMDPPKSPIYSETSVSQFTTDLMPETSITITILHLQGIIIIIMTMMTIVGSSYTLPLLDNFQIVQ